MVSTLQKNKIKQQPKNHHESSFFDGFCLFVLWWFCLFVAVGWLFLALFLVFNL